MLTIHAASKKKKKKKLQPEDKAGGSARVKGAGFSNISAAVS